MLKIGVLVSGSGSNMQSIIDSINNKNITNAKIVTVVSNKDNVYALERAKNHNIPSIVIRKKDYNSMEEFDNAIIKHMKKYKVNLIVMAGFLSIVGPTLINTYHNKIINIHPSLIPAFSGEGFYGLKVHEAALKRGVKLTGATVHFVTNKVDGGPIIIQKAIEVLENDTPLSLQERVKEQVEWTILPQAINMIASNKIIIIENKVFKKEDN
ncbi:MAG: phosphoribosylglycinamide formyltransferase [Bacilli bacterium]